MNNKKIALFMLPLLTQGGGAEKYFINLARNFSERGIETDIITMDENFFRKFVKLLYLFVYRKWFRQVDTAGREKESAVLEQLGKARWIKTSWKKLDETLKKYDVVYSRNEIVDLVLLKVKGYKNLPPVIVGVHTPLYFPQASSYVTKIHNFLYLGFFYRWLISEAKLMHLSNQFTKDLADEKYKIKTQLVYYPFSADEFKNLAQKNNSGIVFDRDKKNICFVGRLSEQKGVKQLFGICEKIARENKITESIAINIFGKGDAESEKLITNLTKKFPYIRYFGHVENKFIPSILDQQDLFITTSNWETLPFNVLEAQALGVPAVAFDIPGPRDIIENGKTGFLVKSEKEFMEKIVDVIEEKIVFKKSEIIQNIKDKFDLDKIYHEIIDMFEKNL